MEINKTDIVDNPSLNEKIVRITEDCQRKQPKTTIASAIHILRLPINKIQDISHIKDSDQHYF